MTAFELLAYALIVFMVLCLITSVGVSIMMFVNRNRFVKEHKERKEKRHEIEL